MPLFKKKKEKVTFENLTLDIDTTGMSEEEIAALNAQAVLIKYDKESAYRTKLPQTLKLIVGILLIAFAVFQLATSIWTIQERQLRPIHLGFAMMLVFLLYPASRRSKRDRIPWYDALFAALSVGATFYIPAA